jgi:hypothetical protein
MCAIELGPLSQSKRAEFTPPASVLPFAAVRCVLFICFPIGFVRSRAPLNSKTLAMDCLHFGNVSEYDAHNLYGERQRKPSIR